VAYLPDPEAERESKRLRELHYLTWLYEGSFEDIPEEDRDRELWEQDCDLGPVLLAIMWDCGGPELDEALAAGVDFTRAVGITEDEIRAYLNRTSDPNIPHKP